MSGKMRIKKCMIRPDKITGRLGNIMFEIAFLYSHARENNLPLVDESLGYYYQDYLHFADYADEIKNLFRSDIPERTDMVAIHVRRGDYVNHPFYVDLSETPYYRDAMLQFPDADFIVFSDDLEWCKQQPVFKGYEFSEGKTELEDLNLMTSCIGHIIANSSFSWWAAFMSPFTRKVVAPLAWHPDGIERTKLPENWIKI